MKHVNIIWNWFKLTLYKHFPSTIYERISRLWITVRSALLRLPALHSTVGSELLSQRNFHTRQPSNERSSSNKFQTQPLCFAQSCVLTTSRTMIKVTKLQSIHSNSWYEQHRKWEQCVESSSSLDSLGFFSVYTMWMKRHFDFFLTFNFIIYIGWRLYSNPLF